MALERPFLRVDEHGREHPAELAIERHHALALLGDEPGGVRRQVRGARQWDGRRWLSSTIVLAALAYSASTSRRCWKRPRPRSTKTAGGPAPSCSEYAGEVVRLLPKTLLRDLTRSGVIFNPRVVEELARLGEKLRDPSTPQGWARLKEIFSEA
jgi:hypothetical protein